MSKRKFSILFFFLITFIFLINPLQLLADSNYKEYSLPDILKITRQTNYDIRTKAENVYQARNNINVAIGRLLPSLNFNTITAGITAGTEGQYFDLATSLMGFLFPSNWFQWKENKLFFAAERRSYAALIANQLNAVTSLFYRVHLSKRTSILYVQYIKKLEEVIKISRTRAEMREDTKDLVLQLENLQIQMKNDRILLNNMLLQQYTELGHAIGLPIPERKKFRIRSIDMPDLNNLPPIESDKLWLEVLSRSYELKELEYLRLAAQYSRKVRMFEFLSPGASQDASFGFGYKSYVEIGSSKLKQVQIKSQETKSNLNMTLIKAVAQYNIFLELFRNSVAGFANAQNWYLLLHDKFRQEGEYNAQEYVSALESLFLFHTQLLNSQHQSLIARAQIDRLLLSSPFYQNLLNLCPPEARGPMPLFIRRENQEIEKAIQNGDFTLPSNDKIL